jgi:rod shape-determining protein MreD
VRPLAYLAVALLAAALQAALLRHLGGGALPATLLVPVVVHLGLTAAVVDGAVSAAAVGYVLDLTLGTPKGLMTFLAVALFVMARQLGGAVDLRGRAAFGLLSGAGCVVLLLGALALQRLAAPTQVAPGWGLVPRGLLEAVATGFLAPLVQMGLKRLDLLLGAEEPDLIT